jgi:hypothetical protein
MGAIKTVLRAVAGMVSIIVFKNHLFEKPGERNYQAPLAEPDAKSKKS